MSGEQSTRSPLLTISEACQILGVSETTLRQWTDEGKVKAFVTPGGHRRYAEFELTSMLRGQARTRGLKDLVVKVEDARSKQKEVIQQYLRHTDWYGRLDDECKREIGERGRRLLELVIQYITRPALQKETLEAARSLGDEFGQQLAHLGLSLSDALEAFVLHRTPVLDTATELIKDGHPLSKRTLSAIQQMAYLVDQTLLALVEGHQHHRSYEYET